jgi:hypothetical protein
VDEDAIARSMGWRAAWPTGGTKRLVCSGTHALLPSGRGSFRAAHLDEILRPERAVEDLPP